MEKNCGKEGEVHRDDERLKRERLQRLRGYHQNQKVCECGGRKREGEKTGENEKTGPVRSGKDSSQKSRTDREGGKLRKEVRGGLGDH